MQSWHERTLLYNLRIVGDEYTIVHLLAPVASQSSHIPQEPFESYIIASIAGRHRIRNREKSSGVIIQLLIYFGVVSMRLRV